ncbi:endonuclease/exonuclease/phosphatase family protein [Puniceibacterium confluentis]|uniref:endonuclease/exonuclease/phosphatase family protein n=1 Tax=Puniceibacterium confluentis TaxID=1958944 RepID=UPI0011B70F46|nr:endonuclease/exonuclease/phosphatase family protein [Puniceibacterium confluentis]
MTDVFFATVIVWLLVAMGLAATVLPFSRIAHGAIRSMEFPRLQIIAVLLALIPVGLLVLSGPGRVAALVLIGISLAVQIANVARFTPVWHSQSVQADAELAADKQAQVSVLAANVKMSNRDYGKLVELIRTEQPDIFIGLETDAPWAESLRDVAGDFLHRIERPQDNGYGMIVYSRLPMRDIEVRNMVVDGVPSVRAIAETRSGLAFRLYAIHPEPPVPNHDSEGRDAEIAVVGMEAKNDTLPSLVVGDINDVAWSATTRRFQRLSGLLDPRVGRGFYNTFDARYWAFRWPLDHLFHDPEFRLVDIRRGPFIGSDHFPMLFTLALTPHAAAHDTPDHSDPEEQAEAQEMIHKERRKDRDPIGSDWEDG